MQAKYQNITWILFLILSQGAALLNLLIKLFLGFYIFFFIFICFASLITFPHYYLHNYHRNHHYYHNYHQQHITHEIFHTPELNNLTRAATRTTTTQQQRTPKVCAHLEFTVGEYFHYFSDFFHPRTRSKPEDVAVQTEFSFVVLLLTHSAHIAKLEWPPHSHILVFILSFSPHYKGNFVVLNP